MPSLRVSHDAKEDRHCQCAHLVIGNFSARKIGNYVTDLISGSDRRRRVSFRLMRGRASGSGTWAFCLCAKRTFCLLYGFSGMKFRWTQKLEVSVPGALQPNRVPGCLHFHSIENPIRIFRIVCEVVCSVASNVTLDVDGAARL